MSIDAEHRGGIIRSSVEISVMDVERRNDIVCIKKKGSTDKQEEFF